MSNIIGGAIGTILGSVGAIGGAIYGAVSSSKYNKKARQLLDDARADNRVWGQGELAKDYTKRSDALAVINRQRELLNEQYNKERAAAVVSGATPEQAALAKAAANDSLAQTMSNVAAGAAAHKDAVTQQMRSQDAAYAQQQAATYANQGAQAAAAGSQVVSAGLGLIGAGIKKNDNNG